MGGCSCFASFSRLPWYEVCGFHISRLQVLGYLVSGSRGTSRLPWSDALILLVWLWRIGLANSGRRRRYSVVAWKRVSVNTPGTFSVPLGLCLVSVLWRMGGTPRNCVRRRKYVENGNRSRGYHDLCLPLYVIHPAYGRFGLRVREGGLKIEWIIVPHPSDAPLYIRGNCNELRPVF
jgi:hypothetical protein